VRGLAMGERHSGGERDSGGGERERKQGGVRREWRVGSSLLHSLLTSLRRWLRLGSHDDWLAFLIDQMRPVEGSTASVLRSIRSDWR
jgi:hypothetical protein